MMHGTYNVKLVAAFSLTFRISDVGPHWHFRPHHYSPTGCRFYAHCSKPDGRNNILAYFLTSWELAIVTCGMRPEQTSGITAVKSAGLLAAFPQKQVYVNVIVNCHRTVWSEI